LTQQKFATPTLNPQTAQSNRAHNINKKTNFLA